MNTIFNRAHCFRGYQPFNSAKISFCRKTDCVVEEYHPVKETKNAWVLDGGGAKGVYQAGAMLALAKAGFMPDVIVGTSVGSLNALSALSTKTRQVYDFWKQISAKFVFKFKPNQKSICADHNIRAYVEKNIFAEKILQRCKANNIELVIQTAKREPGDNIITTAKKHIKGKIVKTFFVTPGLLDQFKEKYSYRKDIEIKELTENNLHDVLLASCSLPVILPPQKIDGELYQDGCIGLNKPVNDGYVALNSIKKPEEKGLLFVMLNERSGKRVNMDVDLWQIDGMDKIKEIVIRPENKLGTGILRFNKTSQNARVLLKRGYKSALRALYSNGLIDRNQYEVLKSSPPFPRRASRELIG